MAGWAGVEVVAVPHAAGTLPGHRQGQGSVEPSIVAAAASLPGNGYSSMWEKCLLFLLPLLSCSYSTEAQFSWKPFIMESLDG